MNLLIFLIPVALGLGALGLAAFVWSLNSGQYDDLDGAAERILNDDGEEPNEHKGAADRRTAGNAAGNN
jgi:cbb3-type cytochrome oxidase maturation protein